jgi:WD40 repeat protein
LAGVSKLHRSALKRSDVRDWAIVLFKLSTGRETMRCSGPKWFSAGLALDPEGKRVAAACSDDLVYVWDTTTGKLLAKAKAHKGGASIVAWSSDGLKLLSGGADKTLAIWDAATLAESSRETLSDQVRFSDLVSRGAVAPSGGGLTLKNSRTELGPRAPSS